MDANKENVKLKSKTRIPLPQQPLPALPKHLLKENKIQPNEMKRKPLTTINSENIKAGPSKTVAKTKKEKSRKIDARYVTMRHGKDDLDWEYSVFKDCENNSVITISDDEVDTKNAKEALYFAENTQRNCLGEARAAVTPSGKIDTLEPNRIRNIKRSLKRPHSRELQGLSPVGKQEIKSGERAKRRLYFNERLQDRLQTPDYLKRAYMVCWTRDYSAEMFSYLIVVEAKPLGLPRISNITRACVINWLMRVNGADGNPAIVQSACWFFDSVIATGHVQLDKLQLVAAACYWIAQKLHGPVMPASKLVKYSKYAFTTERLLAAEKAVLEKLKFPTQPIVAQDFINYLAWWCDKDRPGEIEVAATFLYMSGLLVDKDLCEEFPSVIAAAAVRNAVLLLRKKDLVTHLQMCPVYKSAENKAANLLYTCSVLRRAVRTVAAPIFEYKVPYEHYGIPPRYIAQTIVNAANDLSVMDTRIIKKDLQANLF